MIERARQFTAMGLSAIKMQVAHLRPWREDVRNVHAMRDALGPDIEIMVDVNMGWDAATAIQAGRHMDEADIYWLEEPVVCEDFDGYRRVAAALRTRVVGGESHFTRFDLRPFFLQPSAPILQPDPMRGGLTELRKIAAVADTWGIKIAPHCFHELTVHLLASIPNASYLEYMDWNDDLWVEPVIPQAGMVRPPEAPGHGLRFRSEILRDCRVGGFLASG
jgi:L-alanine-DL-glutamate epimerase-like enolase superfamily enzyme